MIVISGYINKMYLIWYDLIHDVWCFLIHLYVYFVFVYVFYLCFSLYFLDHLSELCCHAREISSYWKRSVVLDMRLILSLYHFEGNVSTLNSLAVFVVFYSPREERWNNMMMIDEMIIIPNTAESLQRFPVFSFYSRNGELQSSQSFMSMYIAYFRS